MEDSWYCKHPSTSLSWLWDEVFHCWDCGRVIGDDEEIEED